MTGKKLLERVVQACILFSSMALENRLPETFVFVTEEKIRFAKS